MNNLTRQEALAVEKNGCKDNIEGKHDETTDETEEENARSISCEINI